MTPVEIAGEIAAAVRVLSRHRIGTIIVWGSGFVVEGGVSLDAIMGRELLVSLAVPEYVNRLHRGAVIVRGDRVERAGVPLSWAEVLDRAAVLATRIAILVDTDTGEIRVAHGTGRVEAVEPSAIADVLRGHALEVVPR